MKDCKVCKGCQLKIQEKQKLCTTAQQRTRRRRRSATGHEANWAVCEKTGGGRAWVKGALGAVGCPPTPATCPRGQGPACTPQG